MPPLDIYGNHFLLTSEVTVKSMSDAYKLQLASKATEVAKNNPLGNYECFLQNAVPVIYNQNPSEECELCKPKRFYGFLCEHQVTNISLAAIWKWYDRHISHRLEVRLKDSRNNENKFHFVPKLSAVQLFGQPPLSNSNPETKTWKFLRVGSIVCPLSNSNPETKTWKFVKVGSIACPLSNSNPETKTWKFVKVGSMVCPLSNSNPETKTWKFVKVGSMVCPLSNSKTETSAAAVNLVEEESTVCPLSNAEPETSAAPVNQVEEGCPVCSLSNSNPETKTGKFIKLGSFTCLLFKTNSESSAAAVNLVEVGSTVCPLSNAKSETSAAAVIHVEEGSTVCPLSNADPETSAVAVNQVEGSTVCPLSNANPEKSAAPVNRIKMGSILFPEPYCSANNPEVIFEFLESEQLQQRKPFLKKIEELFEVGSSNHPMYGDPQKLYSSLHDIHPASWFSVAWYPEGDFNASFLTYHSLGHLVEKLITPIDLLKKEETSVIAFPVLGLASHNAQGEGWFELRIPGEAPEAENHVFDRNFTLAERVRSLEENASSFSRGCVCIRNSVVFNQHPDYELFISQQH